MQILPVIVQEAFHQAPVIVDNEANIVDLEEHYFGVAQDHEEVLYISAGVGLGGEIILMMSFVVAGVTTAGKLR